MDRSGSALPVATSGCAQNHVTRHNTRWCNEREACGSHVTGDRYVWCCRRKEHQSGRRRKWVWMSAWLLTLRRASAANIRRPDSAVDRYENPHGRDMAHAAVDVWGHVSWTLKLVVGFLDSLLETHWDLVTDCIWTHWHTFLIALVCFPCFGFFVVPLHSQCLWTDTDIGWFLYL